MIRRLFKTGNSIVLSLPREMLESLNLSTGDNISLELEREQWRIIITPLEKPVALGTSPKNLPSRSPSSLTNTARHWKNC